MHSAFLFRLFSCGVIVTLGFVSFASAETPQKPIRVRILSYNIHHAAGVDRKLDVERIARVILSQKPDIVALQEVDFKATRSKSVDQPAELARLCEMKVVFGGNIPLQGGQYGNAVLSKFPIVKSTNTKLPNFANGEQRGVMTVEIELEKSIEPVILFATHFDHRRDDKERIASAKAVNKMAKTFGERPLLMAGDLNDVIGSPTLAELESLWTRTNKKPMPTVPVASPQKQIDFVLYRPANRWKVIEVKVLDEEVASDHRGILAILELN